MAEPETAGGLLPSARCVKGIVTATVSDTLAVVLPPHPDSGLSFGRRARIGMVNL